MKFKVLKPIVHGQKVHAPAEKGKPTVLEIPDAQVHEKHLEGLVKDGFLEPLPEPKAQQPQQKPAEK